MLQVKINKACKHSINKKLSSVTCGSSSHLASPPD